jgi:excisionase family DNA binding protein
VSAACRGSDWLTAAEAAEYLRLPTRMALYKRVERGQVRAHRWGRQLRFRRKELDALIDAPIPLPTVSAVAAEGERR